MSTASQPQAPSPAIICDTLNSYQRTAALRGAIDLNVFTIIAEGSKTSRAISGRIGASEKGTRVLCDFLTVIGFLTKQGNEYSLTQDSAVFLNRQSPAYMGTVAEVLGIEQIAGAFHDMGG